jgi:hypothetical protein
LAALFMVVYWLILRPVKKQALAAFRELPGRVAARISSHSEQIPVDLQLKGGEAEGSRANLLKRLIADKVKAEPESASRLVQGWVQQEGQQ